MLDDSISHISENVLEIRSRIEAACERAGRRPEEVTLVAVSKTFSVDHIRAAQASGVTDFGENRVQEFSEKADVLPSNYAGGTTRWHMIGHLQRNKARDVVRRADVFHALDSTRLAKELDRRAEEEGRVLPCLVQVNVSGEASKFGLEPEEALEFIRASVDLPNLQIRGLMTLAEPADDPEDVRPQFRLLREIRDTSRTLAPTVEWLSMGMSGDFEVAIEEGATHVRIGSALFGRRTQ
jgi:PLP dependent protein